QAVGADTAGGGGPPCDLRDGSSLRPTLERAVTLSRPSRGTRVDAGTHHDHVGMDVAHLDMMAALERTVIPVAPDLCRLDEGLIEDRGEFCNLFGQCLRLRWSRFGEPFGNDLAI